VLAWFQRLKLKYETTAFKICFQSKLRPYTMAPLHAARKVGPGISWEREIPFRVCDKEAPGFGLPPVGR